MSGIKDVAKRAGVSISTVSNVLNKSKYVSPELVKKVEQAIEELSYEVNPVARSMKSNKSGIIGVITSDMCGIFYPYVVKGINSVLVEHGYQLIVCDAQRGDGDKEAIYRERKLFRQLIQSRVDGIIFASTVPEEEQKKYIEEILDLSSKYKWIPVVSIERDFSKEGIDSVYFDAKTNARKAVQHLVDCGSRKIGHITGPSNMQITRDRLWGFRKCMEENGLEVNDSYIVNGDYSHQSGYLAMKELLEKAPDLDGVFCGNDQMAIGALKVLKETGKRIPEDIRIIGYDDVFLSSVVEPSLSTIHIQKRHAGKEAAKMLIDRIENKDMDSPTKAVKMEAKLVVRKSTVATAREDWILTDW